MTEEKYFFGEIEDQCKQIITEEVNGFVNNQKFVLEDCDFFIKTLTESIGKRLKDTSDNFKYVINILFLDNSNKGFTQSFGELYDPDTDGVISLHFPFNNITCIVNLIATSL